MVPASSISSLRRLLAASILTLPTSRYTRQRPVEIRTLRYDDRTLLVDVYRTHYGPVLGALRSQLDRIGGEIARATSLVRYAPQARFPSISTLLVKSSWSSTACSLTSAAMTVRALMSAI
jgi:hypothetical protein